MSRELSFAPGPVPIEQHILAIGAHQPHYNRTEAFSDLTYQVLDGLRYVFQTRGSVVLLTASGTAAMESSVLNFLGSTDKALVINGGTFGQRWCDLCDVHSIAYDEYKIPVGEDVDVTRLNDLLSSRQYTALLLVAHETSTGHLYDVEAIGKIARTHEVFFMVDAISSICADAFFMDAWQVDVAILSSHKALALPPGLSFVAIGQSALTRLDKRSKPVGLYFNLRDYLTNQERGQLPYTPAIGLMMQLRQRLLDIQHQTLAVLVAQHEQRAESFRRALEDLPFGLTPSRSSNAMTALSCDDLDAFQVAEDLRTQHKIIVAKNGGHLRTKVFRVAHMGAQDEADLARLIIALRGIASPSACAVTPKD